MKVELIKEVDGLVVGKLYKVIDVKKVGDSFIYNILFTRNNKLSTKWVSKDQFTYPSNKFIDKILK